MGVEIQNATPPTAFIQSEPGKLYDKYVIRDKVINILAICQN